MASSPFATQPVTIAFHGPERRCDSIWTTLERAFRYGGSGLSGIAPPTPGAFILHLFGLDGYPTADCKDATVFNADDVELFEGRLGLT